jgi:hypothetical protein
MEKGQYFLWRSTERFQAGAISAGIYPAGLQITIPHTFLLRS